MLQRTPSKSEKATHRMEKKIFANHISDKQVYIKASYSSLIIKKNCTI